MATEPMRERGVITGSADPDIGISESDAGLNIHGFDAAKPVKSLNDT